MDSEATPYPDAPWLTTYSWRRAQPILSTLQDAADGHDQVMNAMIKELRDIVNSGYAREDMEPYHQEQDDHPLTRLARALQLSPSATTSLARMDEATLEELANKVADPNTHLMLPTNYSEQTSVSAPHITQKHT